ncbi:methionine adenosyltransferase [Peptoniphilus asaccharolyticus DSM 20463]|uniref:S-adenosylmethionine synthase n=1 Tax=Peptoniphilus asaccharolyticus DSM 20463 TaxID=573058 RepID=A0A1W1UAG7_PEPAS|nr:methionine adenosyltransferase [Peptoniphilus asaccharolyticus]MBL7575832.1 methionine adenosyltransferase [Peptoniphilus asaccharolyticus]MBL7575956.1 methionine adenosyltransferase [Peptoniphilus asaccharolyticus]SMB78098.1 methionine adenosyltransferase [Peptoniphilus asaccharolyticus DSM 20463]
MKKWTFTSESVTEGHPDKVCDQVSDAILDAILEKDKNARVACETVASTGMILITGEITTSTYVDFTSVVRETLKEIGYDRGKIGFDCETCSVLSAIKEQSPDIAMGVDRFKEEGVDELDGFGAGDQGLMFGFACDETDEYMPLPISLSHALAKRLTEVRKNGTLKYLRPDGKTQVSVDYIDGVPSRIDTIVISTQHDSEVSLEQIREDLKREVIDFIVDENMMDENTKIYVNPTGRFVVGGPMGDAGLTGRKIIVDTYGGYARHGGGAFSGKDPTKVDRSACYFARYIAKNLVAAGLAKKCEIGLSYAIGVARPTSVYVETFGTGVLSDTELEKIVLENFDARPAAIIKNLDLQRPIYKQVAAYGHFGRNELDLPWEKLDKVEKLKTYL